MRESFRHAFKARLTPVVMLALFASFAIFLEMLSTAAGQDRSPLLKVFRLESEAVRATAGLAHDSSGCESMARMDTAFYRCPVPEGARDSIRSALVTRGWSPASTPSYALDAFRKGSNAAYFACEWGKRTCLFRIERFRG
jgi:hypothetical protein